MLVHFSSASAGLNGPCYERFGLSGRCPGRVQHILSSSYSGYGRRQDRLVLVSSRGVWHCMSCACCVQPLTGSRFHVVVDTRQLLSELLVSVHWLDGCWHLTLRCSCAIRLLTQHWDKAESLFRSARAVARNLQRVDSSRSPQR